MISVVFRNEWGQRLHVDELDEQMTVGECIDNLIEHKFIPRSGTEQSYELQVKGKGTLSQYGSTLASGGIADGDMIYVMPVQRGGGPGVPHAAEALDLIVKAGVPLATGVIGATAAWLTARAQRRVIVKIGDDEFEARSVDELERLMKIALDYLDKSNKKPSKRAQPPRARPKKTRPER